MLLFQRVQVMAHRDHWRPIEVIHRVRNDRISIVRVRCHCGIIGVAFEIPKCSANLVLPFGAVVSALAVFRAEVRVVAEFRKAVLYERVNIANVVLTARHEIEATFAQIVAERL